EIRSCFAGLQTVAGLCPRSPTYLSSTRAPCVLALLGFRRRITPVFPGATTSSAPLGSCRDRGVGGEARDGSVVVAGVENGRDGAFDAGAGACAGPACRVRRGGVRAVG